LKQLARNNEEQLTEFHNLSIYNPNHWVTIPFRDLSSEIEIAFNHTKKLLTHRLKKQRYNEFKLAVQNREYNFQVNRLGKVIKSVMGSKRIYYSMEELRVEGERLIEPGKIHQILTDNFEKWFATPEAELEEDWPNSLNNKKEFTTMCMKHSLPTAVTSKLWESVNKRPENSIHLQTFQNDVMSTPTMQEYMDQVKAAKSGSAAGMSDLSYDMVKAWPEEIHQAVYQSLAELWMSKTVAESWKWKWLNPIPKAVDPTINELRPLCLIEVMRKIWSVIFVKRITTFLHKQNIMNPGQHCGVGKGTETGVLEFAATLETAKELKTEVFISSWDLKRAFDSVDRRLLIFSWERLGVPSQLAQFLRF
jgi:hypothetical protein